MKLTGKKDYSIEHDEHISQHEKSIRFTERHRSQERLLTLLEARSYLANPSILEDDSYPLLQAEQQATGAYSLHDAARYVIIAYTKSVKEMAKKKLLRRKVNIAIRKCQKTESMKEVLSNAVN